MAEAQRPFKVLIVGGSVAGLTLANVLERGGIDFELFEKREVAPQLGQSILLLPCTLLVHEQLGIDKPTHEVGIPIGDREHWDHKGNLFCSSDELIRLQKVSADQNPSQKRPVYFLDRKVYLDNLYNGLSESSKSKIHVHEGLDSFSEHENGVTLRTDKGNVIEGSIIVGADGVHSRVRQQTAQLLKAIDPKTSEIMAAGFNSRYRILTCTSRNYFVDDPKKQFLKDGVVANSYYPEHGVGGLIAAGMDGKVFWAIYIANNKKTSYPSPRYGQADIDEAIKQWGHLHVTPNFTFNDLWANLVGSTMVPMEEGVLATKWHSGGRTVLVGDAVHKATANLGLGGNLCVDDVCSLVNGLHTLLERNKSPTTAEIVKVFENYERMERPRADFVCNASGVYAGFETMSRWYSKLFQVIFPWISSTLKMRIFSSFDSSAPILDFLPIPEPSLANLKA
ncbi:FAD binding domain-containing protein [Rutstroemia sp. NJR-2017a WRK4]|nr:FAD binding domain-containing protein [Rutstroemia sp. NJR-2017a WRK4]